MPRVLAATTVTVAVLAFGIAGTLEAMAPLTPDQLRRRERIEGLIRLAAPGLNLVLAVGDRISRIVESEDHEYQPPRKRGDVAEPPVPERPAATRPGDARV